jgi:KDO2-lipid IV(A) lauroyltransferase
MKNIPRKAGYFIFEFFFLLNLLLPSKRRESLRKNLSHVLGKEPPAGLLRSVYRSYARYYFDLYYDKDRLFQFVEESPRFKASHEIAKKLLDEGRGLIILSMHMGNWDFAGSFLSRMFPGRANIVVEELSPDAFRWFTETRQDWGMKVIVSSDVKAMMRVLKNKEVLVLVTDRDLDKAGYRMDFFGKKAYIPSGPAKLSLAYGAPMMMGVMVRDEKNPLKFIPDFDPTVLNAGRLERSEENEAKLTAEIIALMEKYAAKYPGQWSVLQQVWVEEVRQ